MIEQTPIKILFDTCKELFNKEKIHTLADFQAECKKDKVMGDGVTGICEAMVRYATPHINETLATRAALYEANAIILDLQQELAELKKDHVIV